MRARATSRWAETAGNWLRATYRISRRGAGLTRGLFDRFPRSLRPLAFSLLLTGLLLALYDARVESVTGPPIAETVSLFPREPVIRVRLRRLEVGAWTDFGTDPLIVEDANGSARSISGGYSVTREALTQGSTVVRLPAIVRGAEGTPFRFGSRRYWGDLHVSADGDGVAFINHVPVETYLMGVVLAEMGTSAPKDALEAQAVVSRGYALQRILTRRSRIYDVLDDQSSQVYVGIPDSPARARRAIDRTHGLALFHEGRLIESLYASTCGGATRSAREAFGGPVDHPCLDGVPCTACERSPTYRWSAEVSTAELSRRLGLHGKPLRVVDNTLHASGWLESLTFESPTVRRTVTAARLRSAVGPSMRSTWLTSVGFRGDRFFADGRGFGHGVGLCQYGARGRAEAGEDFIAIVHHYFPGARLAHAWPTPPSS